MTTFRASVFLVPEKLPRAKNHNLILAQHRMPLCVTLRLLSRAHTQTATRSNLGSWRSDRSMTHGGFSNDKRSCCNRDMKSARATAMHREIWGAEGQLNSSIGTSLVRGSGCSACKKPAHDILARWPRQQAVGQNTLLWKGGPVSSHPEADFASQKGFI